MFRRYALQSGAMKKQLILLLSSQVLINMMKIIKLPEYFVMSAKFPAVEVRRGKRSRSRGRKQYRNHDKNEKAYILHYQTHKCCRAWSSWRWKVRLDSSYMFILKQYSQHLFYYSQTLVYTSQYFPNCPPGQTVCFGIHIFKNYCPRFIT